MACHKNCPPTWEVKMLTLGIIWCSRMEMKDVWLWEVQFTTNILKDCGRTYTALFCRNVRNCSSGLRRRGSWMSTMILICFVCKFSHATLTHVCLGSWEAGTATTSTEHSINATVRLASISCTDHKISRILSIWHFIRADQFRNGSAVGNWVVTYRHFGISWAQFSISPI